MGVVRRTTIRELLCLKEIVSGSVEVERSPDMREVSSSISCRVKGTTLKFEVLVLCLALCT